MTDSMGGLIQNNFLADMDADEDSNDPLLLLNEGTSVSDVSKCIRKWLRELVLLRKRVAELEEELRQSRGMFSLGSDIMTKYNSRTRRIKECSHFIFSTNPLGCSIRRASSTRS